MRFHIAGGVGSIGTLISYSLRRALPAAEHPISIIHRTRLSVATSRKRGVLQIERNGVVSGTDGFEHDCIADFALDDPAMPTHIEALIMATKANAVLPIMETLAPRLSADSTLVLIHNGMGVYEDLIKHVFRNPAHRPHIVLSSNTHGAWTKRKGFSVHTGVGEIMLGIAPDGRGRDFEASLDASLPRSLQETRLDDITPGPSDPEHAQYASLRATIAAFLATEHLNVSWRPIHEVHMAMRRKLVVNSVVNPLTALLRCQNGEILKDPAGWRLATALCAEAAHVFDAQWKAETIEQNPKSGLFRQPFPLELTAPMLLDEVKRVVYVTRRNRSSTLNDLLHARKPELSLINGYIIELGRQYKVPTPIMKTVNDMLELRFAIPVDKPEFKEGVHEVQ